MANYKLISFGKIPSTQTHAHELIASGKAIDNTVIIADSQTAGRGRYRRDWVSEHGNLYASFIYKIQNRDPKISYSVAVAIAEMISSFDIRPNIKWPNDILIDGKKVSGVLIEYSKDFIIIGIGINIKSSPVISKYETSKLGDYKDITRDEVLKRLMDSLDMWLSKDFVAVRQRWMDFAAGINEMVVYRKQSMELIKINEDGALVLRNGKDYIMVYGDEISM